MSWPWCNCTPKTAGNIRCRTTQRGPGLERSGEIWAGPDRSGEVRSAQERSSEVRRGPERAAPKGE
eukprot:11974630-Alexandrium_andersonii.AAC.1